MDEVSGDDVAGAAEALIPAAAPVRPLARLRKGRSHLSWVLASGQGRLVGKVAARQPSPAVLSKLAEHQRIAEAGMPVPQVLGFTASSGQIGGRMLIVARYMPGSDAEEAFPRMPDRKVLMALYECGRALAQLHKIPVSATPSGSSIPPNHLVSGVGLFAFGAAVLAVENDQHLRSDR